MPLRRSAHAPLLAAALGALGALGACGGSSFDGQVFRNEELAFRVGRVPSSWRRIETEGVLLAFRDEGGRASISITGRCGKDGDDVPLEALTHHLFLDFTEREIERQSRLSMDGREALHTELRAKLDGVPKEFSVFVLKKNGCVYDFVHVAAAGTDPAARREFASFVETFSTLSP
jgi:hypothetical protein